jgi:hypothetical protein
MLAIELAHSITPQNHFYISFLLWIDLKPTLDRIIPSIIRIGRDNPMFLASKAS